MFHAEEKQQMANEQYGSHKEKLANIQCLNKWLLYNYTQYTHEPMALCSKDAKSCYDWIVLIVAALCLCQLRAPKMAVESMVSTIHGMQHHVQSMYGNSSISQGHAQWTEPIAGIGQGNGTGPHIWAPVNTPLFQILTQEGFLAHIICAISKQRSSMAGFSFIDYVDLCITDPSGEGGQVVTQMQDSINMWAGLLKATGGTLVPEKCFWYYIHNTWDKGKWQYVKMQSTQCFHVSDKNSQSTMILQLSPSEAHRTLGSY